MRVAGSSSETLVTTRENSAHVEQPAFQVGQPPRVERRARRACGSAGAPAPRASGAGPGSRSGPGPRAVPPSTVKTTSTPGAVRHGLGLDAHVAVAEPEVVLAQAVGRGQRGSRIVRRARAQPPPRATASATGRVAPSNRTATRTARGPSRTGMAMRIPAGGTSTTRGRVRLRRQVERAAIGVLDRARGRAPGSETMRPAPPASFSRSFAESAWAPGNVTSTGS